ncbi:MAG: hypothetical protein IJJ47_13120 [Methanosphaera sp.]|nr:hypothetical protein [Methanosphaera sp.]
MNGSDAFILRLILDCVENTSNKVNHIEDLYNILCKIDIEQQKANLLKSYELGLITEEELKRRLNAMINERQRLDNYYNQVLKQ